MANVNICFFIGRLTHDPEVKQTPTGKSVVSFDIAVNTGWGSNMTTNFVSLVAWESRADFIGRFFRKGTPIYVQCHLQNREWQTNEGQKRYKTEFIVDDAQFVESKNTADGPVSPNFSSIDESQNFEEAEDDGEIPF